MSAQELSDGDRKRILKETADVMTTHVAAATAALHGVISKTEGRLVGTGAFVELRGSKYLLTAAHVAEQGLRDPYLGLAHSTEHGGRPAAITNPFQCRSFPSDLALVRLDDRQGHARTAIGADMFDGPLTRTGSDVLFLLGFPGARSRFTAFEGGGVVSEAVPFGTVEGRSSYDWFDPLLHIAIDYPAGNGVEDAHDRVTTLPDPRGMSGTIVWQTNRMNWREGWKPEHARVVGVVTHWDPKAQSLIATRREVVVRFLVECLRREHAYLSWEQRGSPDQDDLADWFAACREIQGLK